MHNCWFRVHSGAKFNNVKIQFQLGIFCQFIPN